MGGACYALDQAVRPGRTPKSTADRPRKTSSMAVMKSARPTGPNGGTCQVIGTAETTSNSTTATELGASDRRNKATPAATTAISHAKPPISSKVRMRELPVKSSTSCAPVARSAAESRFHLVDEDAGAG